MIDVSQLMTEEEFLALPDEEGVERSLIRGQMRENRTMTTRGYAHSIVMGSISFRLIEWVYRQPFPRGGVVVGEARVRLRRDPGSFIGVDVAYFAARSRPDDPRLARFVDGPPILAVEISPRATSMRMSARRFGNTWMRGSPRLGGRPIIFDGYGPPA